MSDMSQEQESFWRKTLEGLRGPFPEIGDDPPAIELEEEEEKPTIGGIDPDALGNFSRLTMDVWFFMNTETNKYYMMQSQGMTDYGEKVLREAVEMVKRRQRRNKG